ALDPLVERLDGLGLVDAEGQVALRVDGRLGRQLTEVRLDLALTGGDVADHFDLLAERVGESHGVIPPLGEKSRVRSRPLAVNGLSAEKRHAGGAGPPGSPAGKAVARGSAGARGPGESGVPDG